VHPSVGRGRLHSVAPHPPHRNRMRRRDIPGGIRFVTCSCQRRLPLLRNPAMCLLLLGAMARARAKFSLKIFAGVRMPEHIHLLVRPPEPSGAGAGRAAGGLAMVERALVDGASGRGAPVRSAAGKPRHVGGMGGVQVSVRQIRKSSTDLSKQRSAARVRCHPAAVTGAILGGTGGGAAGTCVCPGVGTVGGAVAGGGAGAAEGAAIGAAAGGVVGGLAKYIWWKIWN
jgi:hypothetical protein